MNNKTLLIITNIITAILAGFGAKTLFPNVQINDVVHIKEDIKYRDTCLVVVDSMAIYQTIRKSRAKKVTVVNVPKPIITEIVKHDTVTQIIDNTLFTERNTYALPYEYGLLRGVDSVVVIGELQKFTKVYELDTLSLEKQFTKTVIVNTQTPSLVQDNLLYLGGYLSNFGDFSKNSIDYGLGIGIKTKHNIYFQVNTSIKKITHGNIMLSIPLLKL